MGFYWMNLVIICEHTLCHSTSSATHFAYLLAASVQKPKAFFSLIVAKLSAFSVKFVFEKSFSML